MLGTGYNLNQPTIAGYQEHACYLAVNEVRVSSNAPCLDRYPFYPNFAWTQEIQSYGDVASANYNSLQAKFVKRFSKGYEFHANYTWAKGLGYDNNYYNQNPSLDYAVNNFDRKHTFNFYNILNLPIGRGKALLGNAGLSPIIWWADGLSTQSQPWPVACLSLPPICRVNAWLIGIGPCRPNIVGDVRITGDRNNYFTTTGGQAFGRLKNPNAEPVGSDWPHSYLAGTRSRVLWRYGEKHVARSRLL